MGSQAPSGAERMEGNGASLELPPTVVEKSVITLKALSSCKVLRVEEAEKWTS